MPRLPSPLTLLSTDEGKTQSLIGKTTVPSAAQPRSAPSSRTGHGLPTQGIRTGLYRSQQYAKRIPNQHQDRHGGSSKHHWSRKATLQQS